MTIRIQLGRGDEAGSLICAHCRIRHPVDTEMQARYERKARELGVQSDQIWECGACWLAHLNHLAGEARYKHLDLKTDCTHPVPPFKGNA